MVDDATLLRRYAEENAEPAFAELVQRHLDLVYAAALRRLNGDAHAAADVTQQVFTALARRARALGRGVVLPAWLYNTTRNAAVDFIRAERRRRAREQEAHAMHELNADSSADWERLRPLLDAALDELTERDREAIVLRYFARRPFAEIGRTLAVTEDAARMRVDRALEKLRARLARRGIVSTAAALAVLLQGEVAMAAPVGLVGAVTSAALASSAVSAGAATGMISFMGTSKFATGTLAAALAMTLGGIGYELHAWREQSAIAAANAPELGALQARLDLLRGDRKAAERRAADRQAALAAKQKLRRELAAARAAAETVTEASRIAANTAFMERHPEIKQLYLEERRASLAGTYAYLFQRLGLTPVQIERTLDLLVEGTGTIRWTGAPDLRVAYGRSDEQVRAALRELLGEEAARAVEELPRSRAEAWATAQTLSFAAALFDTETPLDAGQGTALQRIFAEGTRASDETKELTHDWPGITGRAADVLSAPQRAVLERHRVQDEFQAALNQARQAAGLPPKPEPPFFR